MNRGAVAGVAADVRSGSFATFGVLRPNVSFAPKSVQTCGLPGRSKSANRRHRGILITVVGAARSVFGRFTDMTSVCQSI